MRVELYHASKFGNGARVAEELRRLLEAEGHQVDVHHVKEVRPKEVPPADLYILGSPTRFGGPIRGMRRFVKRISLPSGSRYAVFATHGEEVPDKRTGQLPSEEALERWRRTIPQLDEVLRGKGLVKVAEMRFFVSAGSMKGPLKEGWEERAREFVVTILRHARG